MSIKEQLYYLIKHVKLSQQNDLMSLQALNVEARHGRGLEGLLKRYFG